MLRISKLTDYAMLIVHAMAKNSAKSLPEAVVSAKQLAEALHLPLPTVSKVLKMLAEAGLLISQRGPVGGYRLQRAAGEISLVDVISAMEGDLAVTDCCSQTKLCTIDSFCALRQNWLKINAQVRALLANFSILDMSRPIQ